MKASTGTFRKRSLIIGIVVVLLIIMSHVGFSLLCTIAKTAEDLSYNMPVISTMKSNDWGVVPGAQTNITEVTSPTAEANAQITAAETKAAG